MSASTSRFRRGVVAVLGAAALAMSGASCAGSSADVGAVPTDGPLWVTAGVGGNALRPPAKVEGPWAGTFGSFVMCSRDGRQISLDKVVPEVKVAARRLDVFVRTVKPDQTLTGRELTNRTPVMSSLGSPPDFAEPYVRDPVLGSFTRALDEITVTGRCREGVGRAVRDGYHALMFTMHTGFTGAHVKSFTVFYTADGQQYAYPVAWEMALCGRQVSKEICPRRH